MKIIIISVFAFMIVLFTACSGNTSNQKIKDSSVTVKPLKDTSFKMMAIVKYTCKMHPEIISDTPGNCPKCGMEMVPIKDSVH